MKHTGVKFKGSCTSKFALIATIGFFSPFSVANAEPLYSEGDWLFGLNAARVLTNETLDSISAGGAPVLGAGIDITNDTTLSFDVSYFLNSSLAVNFFGGLPANAGLSGRGTLAGLPIGETDYGPAILSLQYHFETGSSFSPYVGGGVARILFLDEQGNALTNLDVKDTWAPALQVGMRYQVSENWFANADIRYAPFEADFSGTLGGAPAQGKVSVDPTILNLGVAYRF